MLTIAQYPIGQSQTQIRKQPVFCGKCSAGVKELKRISLYNPFSETFSHGEIIFNPKKSGTYKLKNRNSEKYLTVKYDPNSKGNLTSKENGQKIPVVVLEAYEGENTNRVSYHFMSEDLYREYGYVQLLKPDMKKIKTSRELYKDYPEEGIVGDRLIVEYLKNETRDKLGGVGKLADKMAVKYCLDHNISPNIISYAKINSEVAHYKRGKRFIPPEKDSIEYKALMQRYDTADMNKIIEELLKKDKDDNIFIQGFYYPVMYMPKELFEKYKNEITSKKM